ncbi:MAG: efflux RND transporter periplasmic adaptor subunit [Chitinophagaceae bacterium]|nr:efflux RND transporter periplasmic adaptor subunit [Chitinophagaceae bacterium]
MNRISLLVGLCTLIISTSCKNKKTETEEKANYAVTSPLKVDTSFTKEYVAQIQSVRNVEIRAMEKGYLQSINVDEGRYVKAGQVLFKVVPTLYEAEYLKAQAAAKEAELEMLNAKTLADSNIVSKSESAIAQAKLDEAMADMALAKLHLSMTEIKAPFDGVIDRIPLKLGSLIDEGALLTTISDNKSVYTYYNVPEREYLDYKAQGDTENLHHVGLILANGQLHKYKGIVETIEGQFDNETGNIAFRAKFPNTELLLKHGETGKVQMTIPLRNSLVIPQKATYELQDKTYVYVVDKNNVVKSRNITIKSRLPDIYIVDSGITEGDKILLEGLQSIKENDKIEYDYQDPRNVLSNLQLIKQ